MGQLGAQVPARLGRYELLARLATGGMGEIFLARLEGAAGFEKLYVVKRILPHLADDERFREMLIAEARIASKLSHANICQVYELGETAGQLYIVMEYLEGITLLPLLRKASKESAQLDLGFIAGVIQQSTDGLHYAHELKERAAHLGIIHRDVTPANIFLTEAGVAKVLDFGIAKVKNASANTQTGAVKGKYAYMAPEQLRGGDLDRRVDVFALGVVLYEMLALRRLFQRKTDYLTFRAVMEQPIPEIRRYRADIPDALADVLARALEREPEKRPESARVFATAVLDALGSKRPWTQGEIADFVRANFADEIGKRTAEVERAVHRTSAGIGRSTMPLIAQDDDTVIDDDEGFPSVDTGVETPNYEIRSDRPSRDFGQQTPPPFGLDSTTSGSSLQPLQPVAQAPAARRSLLWPMIAIAMVLIASGALFLVWKQTREVRDPPPILYATPDPAPARDPDPVVIAVAPGSGSAVVKVDPKHSPPPPKRDPYREAIASHKPELDRCANDHGGVPAGARVVIVIGVDGHAKTVALEPATLNTTPLGACIRNVLEVATYPTAKDEKQLSINLRAG